MSRMKIGVPMEIKQGETRVAITPDGVAALVDNGHQVIIEEDAGLKSGISNAEYVCAGAEIAAYVEEVYNRADIIVKVKEPLEQDLALLNRGHTLFCYLHLASSKELTQRLCKIGCSAYAYETLVVDRKTPLLAPMSDVAGRVATLQGATYLKKLLSGAPGEKKGHVLIVGAGVVGRAAAETAKGLGARVTVIDKNLQALANMRDLVDDTLSCRITGDLLRDVDMLIGAVHIPGAKPKFVASYEDIKAMKQGSVVVDVSIDQGGCFETSRATSHASPIYDVNGITHYCVPNVPAAVPHTSTQMLCNATIKYIIELSNSDLWFKKMYAECLNVNNGEIVNVAVKRIHGEIRSG